MSPTLTKKEQLTLVECEPSQIFSVSQQVALELVEITATKDDMNEVAALNAIDLERISSVVFKLWEQERSLIDPEKLKRKRDSQVQRVKEREVVVKVIGETFAKFEDDLT
jgi:hypothetical protein